MTASDFSVCDRRSGYPFLHPALDAKDTYERIFSFRSIRTDE